MRTHVFLYDPMWSFPQEAVVVRWEVKSLFLEKRWIEPHGPQREWELDCFQSWWLQVHFSDRGYGCSVQGHSEPQVHSIVLPHLDPTLGEVGDTFSLLDSWGMWLSAPPVGKTHIQLGTGIVSSAALLHEENPFCLPLRKLLKYNYTPNQHFPQFLRCQTRNPTPKSKHQTSSLKNENKFSNPKAVCFCDWKSFS